MPALSRLSLDSRGTHGLAGGARDDRRPEPLRLGIRHVPEHRLAAWDTFGLRRPGASVHSRSKSRHSDETPRPARPARHSAERCHCDWIRLPRHRGLSQPLGPRPCRLRRGDSVGRALAAKRSDDALRIAALSPWLARRRADQSSEGSPLSDPVRRLHYRMGARTHPRAVAGAL